MKRREKLAITISLVVSILLTAIKFIAYFSTDSVAILSDALESIINIVAAAFAFYSIYLSSLPKDRNHPYGHGKVEFFSIGVEGAMIFVAGCIILFKAFQYFIYPRALSRIDSGVLLIAITAVINFLLAQYLLYSGKKIPSITLQGNGQHIITDAYSSAALMAALILLRFTGWHWIDAAMSLLIGILILRKGYNLIRKSVSGLMDEADIKLAEEVIMVMDMNRRDSWIDVHNLRIQQYGNNHHIDCHLTLPYYYSLNQVHEETQNLSSLINNYITVGDVELFTHTDPCTPDCCHLCILFECPVRQDAFTGRVKWTKENVLPDHGEKF